MPIENAMEFNVAIQTASYAYSPNSTVRMFKRGDEDIVFGSFEILGEAAVEMVLEPAPLRDRNHRQILWLINFLADLYNVTLFAVVAGDKKASGEQVFLTENGYTLGRPFDDGGLPYCRFPLPLM